MCELFNNQCHFSFKKLKNFFTFYWCNFQFKLKKWCNFQFKLKKSILINFLIITFVYYFPKSRLLALSIIYINYLRINVILLLFNCVLDNLVRKLSFFQCLISVMPENSYQIFERKF